jgi:acyl-coenzyme A synthetase/AMP-(fatty) acid ligase
VPGARVEIADLERWARQRLAPYKIPKRWVVVDEMPMTAMGKVQKFVLRQQLSFEHAEGQATPG